MGVYAIGVPAGLVLDAKNEESSFLASRNRTAAGGENCVNAIKHQKSGAGLMILQRSTT